MKSVLVDSKPTEPAIETVLNLAPIVADFHGNRKRVISFNRERVMFDGESFSFR